MVLVVGQDALDASADRLQVRVLGEVGVAGVVEGGGLMMTRLVADQKPSTTEEAVDNEKRLSLDEFAAMAMHSAWPLQ
jgi:hypothetical protein